MPREFVINKDAPNRDGMTVSFADSTSGSIGTLTREDGLDGRYRVTQTPEGGQEREAAQDFDPVDITGASLSVAIGKPDEPPEQGTWILNWNGGGAPQTISFDATAAQVKTALEAAGTGTVTVEKTNVVTFKITWSAVGDQAGAINVTTTGLVPPSTGAVLTLIEGSATIKEVRILTLRQNNYASGTAAATADAGVLAVTSLQTGTSQLPSIQRIGITGANPSDGTFSLNFPRAEVVIIGCRNNTSVKQKTRITCEADFTDSLDGLYFDLEDSSGIVRCWYNTSGGAATAPPTPPGGRVLAIAIVTDDTAVKVANATALALEADAQFTAIVNGDKVKVTDVSNGPRENIGDGNTGFLIEAITVGHRGKLVGTYFVLHDKDGSVGVWFSVSSEPIPSGAESQNRTIEVVLASDDTRAQVATKVRTAIDGDLQFSAPAPAADVVVVTDASGGFREDATSETSLFAVSVTVQGLTRSAQLPYNASADEVALAIGVDVVTVEQPSQFAWDVTFLENGPQAAFAISGSDLVYPKVFAIEMNLSTANFAAAFAETDDDPITVPLHIRLTLAGKLPITIYREDIQVYRSILDTGAGGAETIAGTGYINNSADVSFTSNTTLGSVLTIPVLANKRYLIEFELFILATVDPAAPVAAGGYKAALTFPAATTKLDAQWLDAFVGVVGGSAATPMVAAVDFPNTFGPSGTVFAQGTGTSDDYIAAIKGTIALDNGANAGNIVIQGAQQVSHATPTIFRRTSWARFKQF